MSVDLVYTRQLDPFTSEAVRRGADVNRLLQRNWLPLLERHCSDAMIPKLRAWAFVEDVGRVMEQPDLGWQAGQRGGLSEAEPFVASMLAQPTLAAAVEFFAANIHRYSTASRSLLREDKGLIWLRWSSLPSIGQGFWQVESYTASVLIKLIRHYVGADWQPTVVRVQARGAVVRRSALREACEQLLEGCRKLEIAIEPELLDRTPARQAVPKHWQPTTPPKSFGDTMTEVLYLYQPDYPLCLDTAAHVFDLHRRTIMRRLAIEGLRFRDIRDRLRIQRAEQLLTETAMPIGEIAGMLNYSHPEHFSRAFRRVNGMSPRQYRSGVHRGF